MKIWMKMVGLLLLTLPVVVHAEDYTYTTNSGTITITSYTGVGGAVTITNIINGLPVTSIGTNAFASCTNLTSVTIPNSVTNIESYAFYHCTSLTNIVIPDSVITIRSQAFDNCTSLTSVTIPNSVTSIGSSTFTNCTSLSKIYFQGNAPSLGTSVFFGTINATVYYLPNTTGWTNPWDGLPTVLWNPDDLLTITNLVAVQRPGTKLVDISYDVSGTQTNPVWISLTTICTAVVVNANSLTGDIGEVSVGAGKSMVWDAGADWSGNLAGVSFILTPTEIPPPQGMVLIPAGTNSGTDPDFGSYSLTITVPFYMDATEVTKAQWDVVYSWALANGYSFDNAGSGKAADHPVQTVNWYDCVKWCNARSEKEGRTPSYSVSQQVYRTGSFGTNSDIVSCASTANGYRLPTVAEWNYAARGGLSGMRLPWGDAITHSNANYYSSNSVSYDISSTRGYNPAYTNGGIPYTSPVGSFAPAGYGLYDMIGNVYEWNWDASSANRSTRGGCYGSYNIRLGVSSTLRDAGFSYSSTGFRAVCRPDDLGAVVSSLGTATAAMDTREYVLSIFSAHGMLVPSVGTHNYARLASVTCSVENITSDGWMFMGWTGDISTDYTATNMVVVMDALSKNITAQYSDDADNDGLLNNIELFIDTNPRMKDTDGDNFDDNFEVNEGMNPLKDNSAIRGYIQSHDETFGLYASNAVLDVAVGEVLLRTQSGQARLQLQVERSDDLQSWTNAGSVVEWTLPLDGNKKFFRIKASK